MAGARPSPFQIPTATPIPIVVWAKTARTAGDESYHPLVCHTLDVALVAWALWCEVLPDATRRRVAATLGLDVDAAGRWAAFWAGLHDIGKLSPAFQALSREAADRVRQAGLVVPTPPEKVPHGTISAAVLSELLCRFQLSPPLAHQIAVAVGGHHGVFPRSEATNGINVQALGGKTWSDLRSTLAEWLAVVFDIRNASVPRQIDNPTAMVLAGLVSVADWIGSDETIFRFAVAEPDHASTLDLRVYAATAARRADEALTQLGWRALPAPGRRRDFKDLFPQIAHPRPLQLAAAELTSRLDEPGLVIIEAPMGEGKTEAAILLADHWSVVAGQQGCYIALPTQATSDQMFSRVLAFLTHRYPDQPVNLQLLHGHAALSADLDLLKEHGARLLQPRHVYDEEEANPEQAAVIAAEWFTHRKRGLLAPFGVGTIDQALLAVLQTKHVFVRLFGLANKTVVIDEVHAYDTYQSTLLERLLAWLGALGSSVVLLSATLPAVRRQALLAAYAGGTGTPTPAPPTAAYPRLTWVCGSDAGARSFSTSDQSTKDVRLEWLTIGSSLDGIDELATRLQTALAGGGCVAVVCNTVGRAQRIYQALRPFFAGPADDGEPTLDLLHARFLHKDREQRVRRALIRFGKPNGTVGADTQPVRRPDRAILVSTQIIEQSLDLDFDLIVTDLAPVDLLLQRAGRLHRHNRANRPSALSTPALWILTRRDRGDVPIFDEELGYVYEPHILVRTRLALAGHRSIVIPGDIDDLIASVYDDDQDCPAGASDELRRHWALTRAKQGERHLADRDEAERRWLKKPQAAVMLWRMTEQPHEEDTPDFHQAFQALTRLTGLNVSIVCLHGTAAEPRWDRDDGATVDLTSAPTRETTRRLLQRSVRISHQGVARALLATDAPRSWRKSALLRHQRLLIFTADSATIDGHQLRLDQQLGLCIWKGQEEEGPW